jgi:hypothetical protein
MEDALNSSVYGFFDASSLKQGFSEGLFLFSPIIPSRFPLVGRWRVQPFAPIKKTIGSSVNHVNQFGTCRNRLPQGTHKSRALAERSLTHPQFLAFVMSPSCHPLSLCSSVACDPPCRVAQPRCDARPSMIRVMQGTKHRYCCGVLASARPQASPHYETFLTHVGVVHGAGSCRMTCPVRVASLSGTGAARDAIVCRFSSPAGKQARWFIPQRRRRETRDQVRPRWRNRTGDIPGQPSPIRLRQGSGRAVE